MKGLYNCDDCGHQITLSEYENLDNLFCPKCNSFLEGVEEHKKESIQPNETKNKQTLICCKECKHNFSHRATKCPKCKWVPAATCDICKNEIPLNSKLCPECGDPTPFTVAHKPKQENKKSQNTHTPIKMTKSDIIGWRIFGIILFCSIVVVIALNILKPSNQLNKELAAKDLSSAAIIMCQDLVEKQLKSPSTADFPWFDRTIHKNKDERYIIKSYVDSQNSYGATIRTNWHCDIQYKGEGEELNISNWTLHLLELQ